LKLSRLYYILSAYRGQNQTCNGALISAETCFLETSGRLRNEEIVTEMLIVQET